MKPLMKLLRALGDRWPFFALSLTTMLMVLWVGLTLQSVFTPQPAAQAPAVLPSPLGTPSPLLPNWAKTAPSPLVAPTLPSTAIAPPSPTASVAQPSSVGQTPTTQGAASAGRNPLPQSRYGHLPYQENNANLVSVGTYGSGANQRTEYLDKAAADTFAQMKADASNAGVSLVAISGFRSVADQEKLFERQIQRQGSATAAAKLSAPPGYSEHHTGLTLDIGDGAQPDTDVKFEFENTKAYQWLQANGRRYGVELSFPPNNIQGVSFEPWHWRFTSSPYAAAIFSVARTLVGMP